MTRKILDLQLQVINTKINELGMLVETTLEQSLEAIRTGDQSLAGLVIATDSTIDDLRMQVERLTFDSLTLQQPLGGRDLRFLASAPSITNDLERTGDNAVGIAKLLVRMAPLRTDGLSSSQVSEPPAPASPGQKKAATVQPLSEASIVTEILDLGKDAHRVLQGTMRAFAASNAPAARNIWQDDDVVDVRYHMVRHDLMSMMTGIHAIPALQQDERILQRMTYWLWIAHNLERVGDHCTNVCERIVFILEGDRTINPTSEV
ncbi:MAG: phosphate signaling complex protein PhoU [Ktedonobacteraceae bacterium]